LLLYLRAVVKEGALFDDDDDVEVGLVLSLEGILKLRRKLAFLVKEEPRLDNDEDGLLPLGGGAG
jgi:hypothetical protein